MRLKSLEIKGFKSFADKTVLHFDEGVTGIIGPNGCGKSNIIDAIRWVIGEQKISQLRSENLESLIFNGSKKRNASGLAEVSLTFENTRNLLPTEFSTVTVTRKYYKNGESEYRLNDVNCRLKDIHNLFMDTGISTDSYAIIELGMVDDIIKNKDNSRRRMLEQAAGITIYKTRKREANLKLNATEQDLARIEDLLFEINNQLKSLESQARKAERFYKVKKEYRAVSIELTKAALEGFNLTYKELREQEKTETDHKVQLEATIATAESGFEKERAAFLEKEKHLQKLQREFNETNNTLRENQEKKNLSKQHLQHLHEREHNLKEFIGRSDGQLKGIDESIRFNRQQITEEEQVLETLQRNQETNKSQLEERRKDYDLKRAALDSLRQQQISMQREHFDAEKKVAVSDTSISNLQRSIAQLEDDKQQRSQTVHSLETTLAEKEKELDETQKIFKALQEENEAIKEQILQSQQAVEKMRGVLVEETRSLDAKQNEHDLLKNLIDKMEGYPESVKFLHNNSSWIENVPLLSDIMYVKEEYRAAVENVLEPYLNYYVVENEEQGMKAIHLLEEHRKGKAKFFILGQVQSEQEHHLAPANCIPALSVVENDSRYQTLVHHLLSNVFIAENEEGLTQQNGFVILEKHGKLVKGKYTLSGGSIGLFEGKKIGRVKNLEKLTEVIEVQKEKVVEIRKAIGLKSEEILIANGKLKEKLIIETQHKINEITQQVNSVKNKLENLGQQEETATARLRDQTDQLQQTESDIADTRNILATLTSNVQQHDGLLKNAGEAFAGAESDFNAANSKSYEANLQLSKQQSKIQSLKQELEFKSGQFKDLSTQKENSAQQLADTEASLTTTILELEKVESLVVEMMKQKDEAEKKVNEADQEFYNERSRLNEKENVLKQQHKVKEQTDQLLSGIKDRLNELKLQLSGMKERLMVEFKVDLDAVLDEERTGEQTQEELQEICDKHKKRLENMGEINPTAIEAFTEMKKRFDFITEQKDDLVSARESLMQTIQEVEATANQKFLDTFNQVRENFNRVFQALFSEDDTADIILENPDDLAETGVDILAKPRGKKPTSITQLSGGEKTLTATALLFSIYLIKPAPFCIMDEVDAPLDDSNVHKFAQMIRKFSKDSQFIVVTHNKMSMAAVDVIYGVTMQEEGVSKLVPVDFRGLEHSIVNEEQFELA